MSIKKILILKNDSNDFEQFYLKAMNNHMIDALPMYNKFAQCFSLFFKIHMHIPFDILNWKSYWYGNWKNKIKQYDVVIVFDCLECMSLLSDIHTYNPKCRIILWYWNPIKKDWRILSPKLKKIVEGWSFDQSDCLKYNLKKNNQFFIPNIAVYDEIDTDFVFVGLDKGRSELLEQLYQQLLTRNFTVDFSVIKDKHTAPRVSFPYVNTPLPYSLVQKKVFKSRCVVDVTQANQNGMTLRTLEALFYRKKLLTTNTLIMKEPFYNCSNIFIWGIDDPDTLLKFINSPYVDIPKNIISLYSYQQWLANFNI